MTMEKCIPLELVNKMSDKYNNPWNLMEKLRSMNGKELKWDKRCYLPIAGAMAITDNKNKSHAEDIIDAQSLTALFPWRLHKQIYSFDKDMEELLIEQSLADLVIPVDILNNLPYPCIYIKTNTLSGVDGFFCHFESDVNNGNLEFRFLVSCDDILLPYIVHLKEGWTIKKGIEETVKVATEEARGKGVNYSLTKQKEFFDETLRVTCQLFQLVLYICAENKEIEENPAQKKITKKPTNKKYIKDKFREVQKWDLGAQTGMVIRKMHKRNTVKPDKEVDEDYVSKEGSAKCPHSRRGHWHHFWTGKRNTEERKLVLRWVAPTFIHKEIETEVVTNNVIEKGKEYAN